MFRDADSGSGIYSAVPGGPLLFSAVGSVTNTLALYGLISFARQRESAGIFEPCVRDGALTTASGSDERESGDEQAGRMPGSRLPPCPVLPAHARARRADASAQ